MEEQAATDGLYDDYKFVTREQLEQLRLTSLLGTNTLRPYMHGFFIDARLHAKKLKSELSCSNFVIGNDSLDYALTSHDAFQREASVGVSSARVEGGPPSLLSGRRGRRNGRDRTKR